MYVRAVLMAVAFVGGCVPPSSEEDREIAVLVSVLDAAADQIQDVDPIVIHPHQLRIASDGYVYPGVSSAQYQAEPWAALTSAAELTGPRLCEVDQDGICVVDEASRLPGFIALGEVRLAGDTASVWVVATELAPEHGYAAIYYLVTLAHGDDRWEVVEWKPVGSAN